MRRLKGWGLGRGCALPSWGSGLIPRKNQFCTKNYAILSKFWYFFPILQQKVGDYPPSPESGGTYPPVPPAPTLMVEYLSSCLCIIIIIIVVVVDIIRSIRVVDLPFIDVHQVHLLCQLSLGVVSCP